MRIFSVHTSITTFQNCKARLLTDTDNVLFSTPTDFTGWLVSMATELKGRGTSVAAVVEVNDLF